jgi:hypothetical protein
MNAFDRMTWEGAISLAKRLARLTGEVALIYRSGDTFFVRATAWHTYRSTMCHDGDRYLLPRLFVRPDGSWG